MGAFKIVAFVLRQWSVGTPATAADLAGVPPASDNYIYTPFATGLGGRNQEGFFKSL
jgi:hypothetical protein